MIATPVTVEELLQDPLLAEQLIGVKFFVKLETRPDRVTGHLLKVDTAHGRTLALLVADRSSGRKHIIFLFTDGIVSMLYDDTDRLSDDQLTTHRRNNCHFITA